MIKSMESSKTTNVVIAGLGGQGVLKSSDILAEAVFSSGYDTKKAEVHGMSQRGGSVATDVRFGEKVNSPMVPRGQADYLIVLAEDQVENNLAVLKESGLLIQPADIDIDTLKNKRSLNVALLGILSRHLDISREAWHSAIKKHLKARLHEANIEAFDTARGEE